MKKISVLMSVYKNDIAENIKTAVESITNQTLKPDEIILVVDGPVSETINACLEDLAQNIDSLEVIRLENNVGLGNALKIGTEHCSGDYIARMDSDDIADPTRFEKQIRCFDENPVLSVVGSNGQEFFNELSHMGNIKVVPETHDAICQFMKSRCPFCHMSVMMKKTALLEAGGYLDWYYAEDWYLWIRMYLAGAVFYNIQECLVKIRVNYDSFARRGGFKYYKSIKKLLKLMYRHKMIGFGQYLKEKIKRFVGHVLVPKRMKKKLYMKFMREGNHA